jgi:hypothetical protein
MSKQKKDYIPDDGWLFYVTRPCAVIVKGTMAQAKAARDAVLEKTLDEMYVRWFDDIPGVDRALMTEDPPDEVDGGIVEY